MSDPNSRLRHGRVWRSAGPVGLFLLLLVYLLLAGGSAGRKSVTVDELGHLPSGLYFLQTGDARYASLNPPLLNSLSALPVLLLDLEAPVRPPEASDDVFSFWSTGYHFQEEHRSDYLRIFAAARWVPIVLVAGLATLLFFWARRLAPEGGDLAGLLAAGWVCLSPNVLAQARLVGTDTGTALFSALALCSMHAMLRAPSVSRTLLCGVALGLAQLTKLYALLLYPVFLGVAWVWHARSPESGTRPGRVLVAALVSLLVLNAGYLFQGFGASLDALALQSSTLQAWQGTWLAAIPLPLPAAYLRAIDGQLVEVASTIPTFLYGESFEGGRWYYYPAVLAVKTPPGLLVAFGLGVALLVPRPRLPVHEVALLLAYPVCLLLVLSFSGGRQLGGRALLSAAPLIWLFVAASAARSLPRRWPALAAAGTLVATVTSSVASHPDYLSYFNVFAGGSREGYRYASESNVDIGQDLVGLARYLEDVSGGTTGSPEPVQLLYFGSVDPTLYGIDYEIPGSQLRPGLLAVSVSLYHMGYPMYDDGGLHVVGPVEVRGLGDPIANIGGSIHVYRVGP